MASTLPHPAPPPQQAPFPSKYRFSAVDDLQLPPALSVTPTTLLSEALTLALEREYSQLTVISPERRKLLGYLDVPAVVKRIHGGEVKRKSPVQGEMEGGELLVKDAFTRFDRRKSVGYEVITPDTSLDVLDEFLKEHDFAIGMFPPLQTGMLMVVVTDESRKFVLGVATRGDLEEFAKRRVY
jgi:CBS domain-containing protein